MPPLDEASLSRFHMRAVVASGVGFFTDAYDLFVIGIAALPGPGANRGRLA
jgi:MFS transporter, PHS family, inorganic phosphate transporter